MFATSFDYESGIDEIIGGYKQDIEYHENMERMQNFTKFRSLVCEMIEIFDHNVITEQINRGVFISKRSKKASYGKKIIKIVKKSIKAQKKFDKEWAERYGE